MGRVGLHTLAGGGVAELSGEGFKNGAVFALGTSMAAFAYHKIVRYNVTWDKGGEAVEKSRSSYPVEGANNVDLLP